MSVPFSKRSTAVKVIVLGVMMFCAILYSSCEETPVLSVPPNTTFPMPPMNSGTSLTDLGWVLPAAADRSETSVEIKGQGLRRAKIGDYKGKVLVLDLYATWCAPCRESVPRLVDLQRRYGAKGVEIVGLNVGGAEDRVKVADFAKELGIQYALGFPDQPLTDFLLSDDASIPQTFIFNREGMLVKRFIGYDEATAATMEQVIQTEAATTP